MESSQRGQKRKSNPLNSNNVQQAKRLRFTLSTEAISQEMQDTYDLTSDQKALFNNLPNEDGFSERVASLIKIALSDKDHKCMSLADQVQFLTNNDDTKKVLLNTGIVLLKKMNEKVIRGGNFISDAYKEDGSLATNFGKGTVDLAKRSIKSIVTSDNDLSLVENLAERAFGCLMLLVFVPIQAIITVGGAGVDVIGVPINQVLKASGVAKGGAEERKVTRKVHVRNTEKYIIHKKQHVYLKNLKGKYRYTDASRSRIEIRLS